VIGLSSRSASVTAALLSFDGCGGDRRDRFAAAKNA